MLASATALAYCSCRSTGAVPEDPPPQAASSQMNVDIDNLDKCFRNDIETPLFDNPVLPACLHHHRRNQSGNPITVCQCIHLQFQSLNSALMQTRLPLASIRSSRSMPSNAWR